MWSKKNYECVLLALVLFSLRCDSFDPYSDGPHTITRLSINHWFVSGLEQDLNVWSPIEAGNYPIIYLQNSFGATMPGEAYDDVMSRIASYGFVIVNSWRIELSYVRKVEYFSKTMKWCERNLQTRILRTGRVSTKLVIDFRIIFGIGHSAGSRVLVQYLTTKGCNNFKGLVLLNPVEGPAEQGLIIQDGNRLSLQIPLLLIAAGLDSVPGVNNWLIQYPPCAPEEISNMHYYEAWNPSAPRWFINATMYGHGDFLNEGYLTFLRTLNFCATMHGQSQEDYETYRNFISGQAVTFFKALLEKNAEECETYLSYMEDFAHMPVVATGKFTRTTRICPAAYCT